MFFDGRISSQCFCCVGCGAQLYPFSSLLLDGYDLFRYGIMLVHHKSRAH